MGDDSFEIRLATPEETLAFGRKISSLLVPPMLVYLEGDLGAGKTTFVRGILQGLLHQGAVRSPSFTLIEVYEDLAYPIYHFDLYRLKAAAELENLGFWDYYEAGGLILLEWPSQAQAALPVPDWRCQIMMDKDVRRVKISANSPVGVACLQSLIAGKA
jgi:tRNA threonylcarbamoyladenosine biosynthesis protein TsaE